MGARGDFGDDAAIRPMRLFLPGQPVREWHLRDVRPPETYTVQKGDSLSKIAKREYGKASLWPRIFEANKDQIKNPDLIHPGQKLRIPEADAPAK